MGIEDQIKDGVATYKADAWQREEVSFFRPSLSPDDVGGSTLTDPVIATGTVRADPVIQQGRQTLIVDADSEIRVGDVVMIQHSQFRA